MLNASSSIVDIELASCEAGEKACDISTVPGPTNQEDTPTTIRDSSKQLVTETPLENTHQTVNSVGHKPRNEKVEVNGRANPPIENTEAMVTSETAAEAKSNGPTDCEASFKTDSVEDGDNSICANAKYKPLKSNVDTKLLNNHIKESLTVDLTNGETNLECISDPAEQVNVSNSITSNPRAEKTALPKKTRTTSVNSTQATNANGTENAKRLQRRCNNSSVARTTPSLTQSKKKSNKKNTKFVREPTPGPNLEDQATRSDKENGKIVRQLKAIDLSEEVRTAVKVADGDVTSDKLDEKDRETPREEKSALNMVRDSDDDKTKTLNQDAIAGSNEDSGFESQTRLSDYPITNAVTEWLRRTNSPDVFLTSASTSDSETDEKDDEEMDAKPPKNLQGNPMPALSANSGVDDITTILSRTASCGEFAKTNNNNIIKMIDQVETNGLSAIGRRKRDSVGAARRKTATRKIVKRNNRNVDEKTQSQLVSSLVSCRRLESLITAVRLRNPPKSNNVGDVCEFTEKDSVAGMRVALSSRINSRVSARRTTKTSHRIDRDPVENIDIRMRRIDDTDDEENSGMVSVRTFEKGEIIVSRKDGKLLSTSSYEPIPFDARDISSMTKIHAVTDVIGENERVETREKVTRNSSSSENDENMMSSVSIEEPDVLECWEAETIEPVITIESVRRMLQSTGMLCEGEAAEEDNYEIEKTTMEHVRKYYRLGRDSAVSVEEESSEMSAHPVITSESRKVPNNPKKAIEKIDFCNIEDIPIVMPDKRDIILADEKIPIDEAFEVYESCYNNGKSSFLASFDSKLFKQQRPLYGQNGEGPIPRRAVCCNIQ